MRYSADKTSTFFIKFGSLSLTVTLKIRSSSPKPNLFFSLSQYYIHVKVFKIHQPFHDSVGKHVLASIWQFKSTVILKIRSRSPKPNQLFMVSRYYIRANLVKIHQPVHEIVQTSTFWLQFGNLSPTVTLKIRSRSLKPNQLFMVSRYYIHANLVKIHQPVHEILCTQENIA